MHFLRHTYIQLTVPYAKEIMDYLGTDKCKTYQVSEVTTIYVNWKLIWGKEYDIFYDPENVDITNDGSYFLIPDFMIQGKIKKL